jgi:choline dehydrogenase-like flavoprotein
MMAGAERADVVVIGAGAAGAALSWRLASRGARVICLEQGDWVRAEEFPSARPLTEVEFRRGRFNFDPNIRRRPEDYPVVTESPGVGIMMFNGVGGSTVHWEGHFPRFHPSDFRVRSLDGIADDWPIRYEDLEPYYDENDRMLGVSGIAGDPANPPRTERPMPPLPLGKRGLVAARGFEKLGWHWWPSDNAIASRDYDGRKGCDFRGFCNFGCTRRAKASADITYWPKAVAAGAVLKTWARVRAITVDERGRARGALYFDRRGELHEQLGHVIVACCNGVGTPRLLLNSRSKLFPNGLANSSGLVGKNLMLHPAMAVDGIFDERVDGHVGPTGNPLFSQQFYETDGSRGFVRGYTLVLYGPAGPFSQATAGTKGPLPWGADHHRQMRRDFAHSLTMVIQAEDLPEESNTVELDPSAKDANGIPAPRVNYKFSEDSMKRLRHGLAAAQQVLEAAGAGETRPLESPTHFAHLMGTARMGSDPKRSVVNAWNQAHDVPNLFVVDGSSFTTCAAVNPTSTIGALALRAADSIWDRRREWS